MEQTNDFFGMMMDAGGVKESVAPKKINSDDPHRKRFLGEMAGNSSRKQIAPIRLNEDCTDCINYLVENHGLDKQKLVEMAKENYRVRDYFEEITKKKDIDHYIEFIKANCEHGTFFGDFYEVLEDKISSTMRLFEDAENGGL